MADAENLHHRGNDRRIWCSVIRDPETRLLMDSTWYEVDERLPFRDSSGQWIPILEVPVRDFRIAYG
jgi:hypothetical protein